VKSTVKLGHIWGIPIGLDWTWFLIFALVTWSLAAGFFPDEYPTLSTPTHWLLGTITSVLFFGSVLLHELGHAYVAMRNGVPVRGIKLFIFGGVAEIAQEPRTAGAEFRIAIAGPVVSLVLAALFGTLFLLDRNIPLLAAPSAWLARINLMLVLFNMLPGFPLDGGRILRAAIWQWSGNLRRANQVAAFTGQMTAFGLMGWGVFLIVGGAFFNGLWAILIGWFLQNAAAGHAVQSNLQETLRDVTVDQVMTRTYPKVSPRLPLERLVEDHVLSGGQRYFLVSENGHPDGLVTLPDVTAIPREQWKHVTTAQVMVPWERMARVQPHSELLGALQVMDDQNIAQVPVVVDGGQVVGVLSREQILHYIRARAELGV
jgi:Zn-dependent protease